MSEYGASWPPEDPELARFKGPHVAVDVAVLTVEPDPEDSSANLTRTPAHERGPLGRTPRLAALLMRRQDGLAAGEWALPGRMVRERERLHEAVAIALETKCGIRGLEPQQLFVSDAPARDSRGWVMSVGHRVVVPWQELEPHLHSNFNLALVRIMGSQQHLELPQGQSALPFEHEEILRAAVAFTRIRYQESPDPDRLLPDFFTLYQLRRVHEAILGEPVDKDLFRRRMSPKLEATGEYSSGSVGKPAQLFKRREK
jgi:8-oxo-dGTP diphosphatase